MKFSMYLSTSAGDARSVKFSLANWLERNFSIQVNSCDKYTVIGATVFIYFVFNITYVVRWFIIHCTFIAISQEVMAKS